MDYKNKSDENGNVTRSNGYKRGGIYKTLFMKNYGGKLMIDQIYVDDIVFGGMLDQMVKHFVQQMKSKLELSLVGELTYFLGLQEEENIFVSQRKYAQSIVKNFGLENASHKRTPTATQVKITKDEKGVDVDQSLYRSIFYLTTRISNIGFYVGVFARYQANPKASHLTQVKTILKYVNGT
ncbi:uncharacterized mitochondrial protein AtMg00810-like [Lathyrus oleraceus]|uniref:uncharacterized mitochondrial protein AtMg00810-like n=1 Tax=Pisum sativum TaxID=3888 RepID=UPI0021D18ABB|nr:uncharacterized mitochondrial protein AtMg00810-like [Pisum sativum]